MAYADFDVREYVQNWDKFNLFRYVSEGEEPTLRAYQLANYRGKRAYYAPNVRSGTRRPKVRMRAGINVSL
ncbi:hypothetical protein LAD64_23580 [Klebsiella pneumoniae]|nr:hypothetical protein [Klebsiella pneumoniae]